MADETAVKVTGNSSKYLAKLGLKHKCLGFDYQGVEIIQVTREDLLAVCASLYTDGWNYLRNQVTNSMSPPWNYIRRPPCYASVTRPVTHPSPSLLHMRHPPCYTCVTLPVAHPSPALLHIRHPPCYTTITAEFAARAENPPGTASVAARITQQRDGCVMRNE